MTSGPGWLAKSRLGWVADVRYVHVNVPGKTNDRRGFNVESIRLHKP